MEGEEFDQIRRIVLALPGVTERISHGEPCFFVQGKRPLCYFHHNHRGDGRISLWCPALPGVPADLTASEPDRFFHPTPSVSGGVATWLGVYLDTDGHDRVDRAEIAGIVEDAFRTVAPEGAHRRARPPLIPGAGPRPIRTACPVGPTVPHRRPEGMPLPGRDGPMGAGDDAEVRGIEELDG
jgi:hypothetical protein